MNEYQKAIKELIDAMEMQLMRESGSFHIPPKSAKAIWKEAINKGRALLPGQYQLSEHFEKCSNCNTILNPIDQNVCEQCGQSTCEYHRKAHKMVCSA